MNLAEVRKSKGLSQKQMSEKLGIDVTLVSHIERGTRPMSKTVEEKLAAFVEETKDVLPEKVEKAEEKTVEKAEEKITDVIGTLETTTSIYDIRDLYAAAFLCGIASKIDIRSRRDDYLPEIADRIFEVADAMVKARG